MSRPRCPRCGEPAREAHGSAVVRFMLDAQGRPAQVIGVERARPTDLTYRCGGGGHTWKIP